jgi:putative ABC transport system permease protein
MGLLRIARGELVSRWGRNLLTVIALALGVALIVAVSLLGRSATQAFAVMADALGARIDLEVSAGEAGFAEEMHASVRSTDGVASAAPIVLGTVFLSREGGESLAVMGIDTLADRGAQGDLVRASPEMPVADPLATLNTPEAIVVTEELVHRLGLARDQRLDVETPSGRQSLTVRGAVRTEGFLRVYGDALAFMDILAAQRLFAKDRRYDRISVDLEDGVSPEQAIADLRDRLPGGMTVQPPQQRRADMDAMLGAFRYALVREPALAPGRALHGVQHHVDGGGAAAARARHPARDRKPPPRRAPPHPDRGRALRRSGGGARQRARHLAR